MKKFVYPKNPDKLLIDYTIIIQAFKNGDYNIKTLRGRWDQLSFVSSREKYRRQITNGYGFRVTKIK